MRRDNPEGNAVLERPLARKSLIFDDDSGVTDFLDDLVLFDREGDTPVVQEHGLVLLGSLMSDTGKAPILDGEGLEEVGRVGLLEASRSDLGDASEMVLPRADESLTRVDDADTAALEANSRGLGAVVRKTHGDERLLAEGETA